MTSKPLLASLTCALLGATFAAPTSGAEVADISLEQLLSTEIAKVSGAARIEQLISEAPGSVTILTSKDIRRHGWRTLADLLRSTPGITISYNNLYTTASIRGQTSALDLGSFMLLMIDGERLSSNVSDVSLLGDDMPLDLEWIDRVEIVSGASSAVYGANATLAVVNIITRSEERLPNVEASLGMGSNDAASWRVAGKTAFSDGHAAISASRSSSDGYLADDHGEAMRWYARLAKGDFTLTAMHMDRDKAYPYLQPPVVTEGHMETRYQSATLGWRKILSDSLSTNASLQYGKSEFNVAYGNPAFKYRVYPTEGSWWSLDASLMQKLGAHTLLYGLDWTDSPDTHRSGYEVTPLGIKDPFDNDESFTRHAFYIQDFWRVRPDLTLHLALRHEADERYKDDLLVPRLGMVYQYTPNTTFKLTYGESFRAHTAFEISTLPTVLRQLITEEPPEQVKQWEARIEHEFSSSLRVDASLYRVEATDQLRYVYTLPTKFLLGESSTLNGIETSLLWRAQDGSRLRASVSLLDGEYGSDGAPLFNSPEQMLKLNYSFPVRPLNAMLGLEALYTGKRRTLVGTDVPAYTLLNIVLSSSERPGAWQWQAGVYNVFDKNYYDPSPYSLRLGEIEQEGRVWRLGLKLSL